MTTRTLGVVGTLTWDRYVEPSGEVSAEGWGGIAYAMSALSAAMPEGWTLRPLVKIGADRFEEGRGFLTAVGPVDPSGLVRASDRNNTVELRYRSPEERTERLSGGVPGWRADELSQRAGDCDALYVNFVSGFEMGLRAARSLRSVVAGPLYADLHSLFLGVDDAGTRVPRALDDAWAWVGSFDAVQLNETELGLLCGDADPWSALVARGPGAPALVAVTRGPGGATCVTSTGAPEGLRARVGVGRGISHGADPSPTGAELHDEGERAGARVVTMPTTPRVGDPTGCGDVWGATFFARLLGGDTLERAMAEANRLAGANVEQRAAAGLAARLGGA